MQRILKIRQKSSKMSIDYHTFWHAFSERWLLSCCFTFNSDSLEGQLVNSRVPKMAIYLHMRSSLTPTFHIHPLVFHE